MRTLLLLAASSVVMLACGKPPCSAANCAIGCCDASDTCQVGTQPLACGIAGGTCSVCSLAQQCVQGTCFGGTGAGGGGGGSGGGGGGSVGGGGGTASGGGAGMNLIPTSATVPLYSEVELSAELLGGAPDQLVTYSIESGGGSLVSSGPSTATYRAYSANATVRIRAQANYLSSLARYADFTVSDTVTEFLVVPQTYSRNPYVISLGSQQTFAALRVLSAAANANGLGDVDWTVWPSGTITDGTTTITSSMQRIYAHERSTNIWASAGISPQTTSEPSVVVTPALSTVGPNGVVQLTAMVSTGASVRWDLAGPNTGTVSSSGTYTAPSTPGVYVVRAAPDPGTGLRYALATVIVQ